MPCLVEAIVTFRWHAHEIVSLKDVHGVCDKCLHTAVVCDRSCYIEVPSGGDRTSTAVISYDIISMSSLLVG